MTLVSRQNIFFITLSLLLFMATMAKAQIPITGLIRWYSADSVQLSGSNVIQWNDQSGLDQYAIQATATKQPKLVANIPELNYQSVVRFDGVDDFMAFAPTDSIRTAFFVVKHATGTSAGYQTILGHQTKYDWVGSIGTKLFSSADLPNPVKNGQAYVNQVNMLPININKPNQYTILSFVTSSNASAQYITNDRNVASYYWAGDYAEIILFKNPLNDSARQSVEQYLRYKYAPPVTLASDINNPYGFADTTINAYKPWFTSYLWSNGSTDSAITVSQSGTYAVTVTDIFGFTSTDSVKVTFPALAYPITGTDTTLCLGDTLLWDTGLGSGYSYSWLGKALDTSKIAITTRGRYAVTVTDTLGFFIKSDTLTIAIDSFPAKNSLGPDRSVCKGEAVTLTQNSGNVAQWLWSTGSTQSFLNINTTGQYSVTVSNARGCTAADTADYTLSGIAPTLLFAADTVCHGDSTAFSNLSFVEGGGLVDSYSWDFGDGTTSALFEPKHRYAAADTFLVTLTATSGGCSNFVVDTVLVNYRPQAGYTVAYGSAQCTGVPVQFTDTSVSTLPIAQYQWNFGDGLTSSQIEPLHTYTNSGSYAVTQTITAHNGCADSVAQTLTVSDELPLSGEFTLTSPANHAMVTTLGDIAFSWEASSGALAYRFSIASDSALTTNLFEMDTTATAIGFDPGEPGTWYWQVAALNLCGNERRSEVQSFEKIDLSKAGDLLLWYDAASIVADSGQNLPQWNDVSALANHATQATATKQPKLITVVPELNGNAVVRFDGVDDFMAFTATDSIRTAFFVVKHATGTSAGYQTILGHQTKYDWVGSIGTKLFSSADLPNPVKNGQAYVNQVNMLPININKPNQYTILSFVTSSNASAQYITNDRNVASYYWAGDYAEIILFKNPLNDSARQSVEQYLRYKYAPPVTLASDINNPYGFADTTINAYKPWFTSYLWSNGSTDSAITVSQSGTYAVTVTDIFGFTSTDSVKVTFPALAYPITGTDTTLCLGDTLLWDTGLGSGYSYSWLGKALDTSKIAITTRGRYAVTVTDTLGFFIKSDTLTIAIDSFPAKNSLGPDRSVCKGEAVTLTQNSGNVAQWLWSTGSTQSFLNINTTGQYSVTVSNARGCTAADTADYTLSGIAPTLLFAADTVCHGDSTAFSNLSFVEGGGLVDSYSWDFGDGTTSALFEPKHRYAAADTFLVTLTATSGGCSNFVVDTVLVNYRPQAGYTVAYGSAQCTGVPVQFTDTSVSTLPIAQYQWNFGDGLTSSQIEPLHTYTNSGSYAVTQTITAHNGCADSVAQTLTVSDELPLSGEFTLTSPANHAMVTTLGDIAFSWEASSGALAYRFSIASDSALTTNLFEMDTTATAIGFDPGEPGTWYWQVAALNLCGNERRSEVQSFEKIDLSKAGDLLLWYDAASIVADSGQNLPQWNDVSALANHATQATATKQPRLITNVPELNGNPVVRFDGVDDFMAFTPTDSIRSAFFVVKHATGTSTTYPPLLGHPTKYDWITLTGTKLFNASAIALGLKNGQLFVNNTLSLPADINKPTQYSLFSFVTSANVSAQYITNDRNGFGYWNGDYAEIILFKNPLNDSARQEVEQYLRYKYTPPITLVSDINNPYGFADTVITAYKPWFTSYLWSNGSTDSAITVSKNGTYAVTVTDIFGFTSFDSIKVNYPEPTNINDTLICRYDTVLWNPGLNGDYTYEWKSSSDALSADLTESELAITDPGKYWLIIRDTLGNPWYSDTITVSVDEFPTTVSLGNDTTLCKGSRVYLQNGYQEGLGYLWSNGEITEYMTLETAGTYSVKATNALGCVGVDTAAFDVNGVAPNPDFSAVNFCFNDTVQFTDISASPDGSALTSWSWDFGDGTVSISQHPVHRYVQPNTYIVSLTVTNEDICTNTIRKDIPVYHLPEADFIPNATCSNAPVTFYDKTTSVDGAIVAWNWTFPDGSTSQQQNATITLTETGYADIELIVYSELGCSDTLLKQIDVKQGPLADFSFSPACDGYPVYFSDKSESFLNMPLQYRWIFEPGMESNQSSPSYQFPAKGIYNVTLQTTQTANNCSSEVVKPVEVSDNPTADFSIPVFCAGNSATLVNESYSDQGVVDHWKWNVDEVGVFYDENLSLKMEEPGDYPVILSIEDSNGCRDTMESVIPVNPLPTPSFETSVEKGPVPLLVSFSNLSSGANRYHWDFGDGSTSELFEPQHTYTDSGVYQIRLIAESTVGCSDSVFNSVKGIVPAVDLAVLQVLAEQSDGFLKVGMLLQNYGTLDISNINVYYITNYGGNFKEKINQIIPSGSSYWHDFATQIEINPSVALTHVCASAYPVDVIDEVLGNNEACQAFENGFKTLNPYPNPSNHDLVIEYIIPFEANVSISLFDDMGKIKKILYDDKATAGFNRHIFNISDLAYGMYIYKIEYQGITYSYQFLVE